MKQRFKIAYGLRCPAEQHACFGTTQAHLKTRPGGWFISVYAKAVATSSVGNQSLSHLKWWAKPLLFFALLKSKTKAKQQSFKGISLAWSTRLAGLPVLPAQLKRLSRSSGCNEIQLPDSAPSSSTLIFGGHGTHCQRWPNKPPPNALENCVSSTATHSRFMTLQTHKLSNGLKALKSGQRIRSLFAVGRSLPWKLLSEAAAFCAKEQKLPLKSKSRERKKEDEYR